MFSLLWIGATIATLTTYFLQFEPVRTQHAMTRPQC